MELDIDGFPLIVASGMPPAAAFGNGAGLRGQPKGAIETIMGESRSGQIAVIFVSERTFEDDAGYAEAAAAMAALAAQQPGYRGADDARGDDRIGITVSYWADEASAIAWRQHPEHAAIRERGRGLWYRWYALHVAEIGRSYGWARG